MKAKTDLANKNANAVLDPFGNTGSKKRCFRRVRSGLTHIQPGTTAGNSRGAVISCNFMAGFSEALGANLSGTHGSFGRP